MNHYASGSFWESYGKLPQGQAERTQRTVNLVEAMDREGFGNCTNHYECAEACPKEIPVKFIAELNRDLLKAAVTSGEFGVEAGTNSSEPNILNQSIGLIVGAPFAT